LPGSEDQKLYVLPHMWTLDLEKCSSIIGRGSHTKGRTHTGGIGKGRKPKT
jgi:hypothetical protein